MNVTWFSLVGYMVQKSFSKRSRSFAMLFSICNEKKKFHSGNTYFVSAVRMNNFCSTCIGSLNYIQESTRYPSSEISVISYVTCNLYQIYPGVGHINKCLSYINFTHTLPWQKHLVDNIVFKNFVIYTEIIQNLDPSKIWSSLTPPHVYTKIMYCLLYIEMKNTAEKWTKLL